MYFGYESFNCERQFFNEQFLNILNMILHHGESLINFIGSSICIG